MIPHNRPTLGDEEEKAALRVLRSGWVAQGDETAAFESDFCRFMGLPQGHAVAVSSGSAALFLALWSLEARGKTVSMPSYACSALRHAAALAGAGELIVDTPQDSPNAHLRSLKVRGAHIAIAPHYFGLPVDLSGAGDFPVVEDCAQALGARVRGERVGLQGRLGVFSFFATKLITSGGQGGMVVSRDRDLIDKIRDFRQFDERRDDKKRFNLQMTDLAAAVGRVQLGRLPDFLKRRAEIFERYRASGLDLLDTAPSRKDAPKPARFRAVVRVENPRQVIGSLATAGVKAAVPIEEHFLLGTPADCPNALALARGTVSLPIYPTLTDAEADTVIKALAPKRRRAK